MAGYWYTIKAFRQVDVIEVPVNTVFSLKDYSRYTVWDKVVLIPTYKHYKGVYPNQTANLSYEVVDETKGQYKIVSSDVDAGSIAYVLLVEDDLHFNPDYFYPNYSNTYTGEWKTQYILNAMEVYNVDSSNDFTLILPKDSSTVKFFPVFDYMFAPLGLREYTFSITKVNNRSYKIQPLFRYSNKTDFYKYTNAFNINVSNSSIIRFTSNVTYRKYLRNNDNSPHGTSTVYYRINNNSGNYPVYGQYGEWERSWEHSHGELSLWHPVEYQNLPFTNTILARTNELRQSTVNIAGSVSLGKNATKCDFMIAVTRLGDSFVPYINCRLKVFVVYE